MITALGALLALIGTPLFVVIAVLAILHFAVARVDLTVIFIEMYRIADSPALAAIPLFALAGFLLAESRAADRLVRVSQLVLGWLPGGLAIVAVLICAVLTALTGASGMTIVALGGILYPALVQRGYSEQFSLGLLTTGGSVGLLFPPSMPLILYGVIAGVSIDQLFVAGIAPGVLVLLVLAAYCYRHGRRLGPGTAAAGPAFTRAAVLQLVRESAWELLLPPTIVLGIVAGVVAVSEAAALSVLYVLVVEAGVRREIPLGRLPAIARSCMVLVGSILILLAASLAYTSYLVDAEVPARLLGFVRERVTDRLAFLLLLNLFLLAVGCMLDMFSALIVVVPLILPVATAYGVDPIHLGIIFLTNLEIGYSTPPVGLNLFIASMRFGKPVLRLYRASVPFLGLLLLVLVVVTYVPALSLFLTRR